MEVAVALIFVAWMIVDARVFLPRRIRSLQRAVVERYPQHTVLATLQGRDSHVKGQPGVDHIGCATRDGLIFCQRRRFRGSFTSRFDLWSEVGPVTVADWDREKHALWVHGHHFTEDVDAFLEVARPLLTDPSGLVSAATNAVQPAKLRAVLHGTHDQGSSARVTRARAALLACTDAGVVIAHGPQVTVVGWDQRPVIEVTGRDMPTVRVAWGSEWFVLRFCVLGDVSEFTAAVHQGSWTRASLGQV